MIDLSAKLEKHETYGNDFNAVANQVYISSTRLESKAVQEPEDKIDGIDLGKTVADDIAEELERLPSLTQPFREAMIDSLPQIKEEIENSIARSVKDGEFKRDSDQTRKHLGRLAKSVIAQKLEI